MQKTQKKSSHNSIVAFIDYRPAELCIKTQWLVVYYAKNPVTKKLERFRLSVPVLKSKTERIKQGKRIALEVNKKLETGWLPYYDETDSNDFKTFEYCSNKFLEYTAKDVANGTKRLDTERSYKSGISMLKKYISDKKIDLNLMIEINKPFVVNYLDYVFYEKEVSSTTYNNYVVFLGVFFSFCLDKGFCKQNFAVGIKKKQKEEKKRVVFTSEVKNKVKMLIQEDKAFYTMCMMTYFCFIRETEMTKLKVSDINLKYNFITICSTQSKNKKTQNVTIPDGLKDLLENHIKDSNIDDYLFSKDDFKTGKTQLKTKKIYDTWTKFRKQKNISNEFQFYSLKDSGITDLINTGIPSIKVRDQARHYDFKITEAYISRNKNCDDIVKNSNLTF